MLKAENTLVIKEQFEDICEKIFSLHIIPTNFLHVIYSWFFLEQVLK